MLDKKDSAEPIVFHLKDKDGQNAKQSIPNRDNKDNDSGMDHRVVHKIVHENVVPYEAIKDGADEQRTNVVFHNDKQMGNRREIDEHEDIKYYPQENESGREKLLQEKYVNYPNLRENAFAKPNDEPAREFREPNRTYEPDNRRDYNYPDNNTNLNNTRNRPTPENYDNNYMKPNNQGENHNRNNYNRNMRNDMPENNYRNYPNEQSSREYNDDYNEPRDNYRNIIPHPQPRYLDSYEGNMHQNNSTPEFINNNNYHINEMYEGKKQNLPYDNSNYNSRNNITPNYNDHIDLEEIDYKRHTTHEPPNLLPIHPILNVKSEHPINNDTELALQKIIHYDPRHDLKNEINIHKLGVNTANKNLIYLDKKASESRIQQIDNELESLNTNLEEFEHRSKNRKLELQKYNADLFNLKHLEDNSRNDKNNLIKEKNKYEAEVRLLENEIVHLNKKIDDLNSQKKTKSRQLEVFTTRITDEDKKIDENHKKIYVEDHKKKLYESEIGHLNEQINLYKIEIQTLLNKKAAEEKNIKDLEQKEEWIDMEDKLIE